MVVTKTRRKNTELDLLNTNGLQRGIGGDQNHREIGKLYMMLHCQHRNDFALQWAAVKFTSMFTNCGRTKSQLDSVHKPEFDRGQPKWIKLKSFYLPLPA